MMHMPIAPDLAWYRREERHLTVLVIAKVRSARGEFACVIKNVSRRGLKAKFPAAPDIGERLTFALRGLPEMAATVRWTDGLYGGAEFDDPLDLTAMFAHYGLARMPRAPRFLCCYPASLFFQGREHAVDLLDISLGGAKVGGPLLRSARIGNGTTLLLSTFDRTRFGTVRWHEHDRIGIQFSVPLTLDELAAMLSVLQGGSPDPRHRNEPRK